MRFVLDSLGRFSFWNLQLLGGVLLCRGATLKLWPTRLGSPPTPKCPECGKAPFKVETPQTDTIGGRPGFKGGMKRDKHNRRNGFLQNL